MSYNSHLVAINTPEEYDYIMQNIANGEVPYRRGVAGFQ